MALDRRLKYEAPIHGPRDARVFNRVMRACVGCAGLSAVIVLLGHY